MEFKQDKQGLKVKLPARAGDELAYVIKLGFDGGIPAYDNFVVLDVSPHYHLVPGGDRGDHVVGADLALTTRRKEATSQWKLEPAGNGIYVFRNRADPNRVLASGADDRSVVLAEFAPDDRQRWKISSAPEGMLTITNVRNPDVALALPGAPASGIRVNVAGAPASSTSRWSLLEVCDLKQEPFRAHVIPGVIEAEDFDHGCPGDAYRDRDDINEGGLYRPDLGVDLGECSAGGYTLGWTRAGEWTAYTVNIEKAGAYRVAFHVATAQFNARFHLECEGADVSGPVDVPNTKSFQNWVAVEKVIQLPAGRHVLKVVIDGDSVNLDRMVFEEVR